jgi:hypothetical protein
MAFGVLLFEARRLEEQAKTMAAGKDREMRLRKASKRKTPRTSTNGCRRRA